MNNPNPSNLFNSPTPENLLHPRPENHMSLVPPKHSDYYRRGTRVARPEGREERPMKKAGMERQKSHKDRNEL